MPRHWIWWWLAAGALACSESQALPPKRPNTELIVGGYERHPPEGETAIRFRADGSVRLAKNRSQLDAEPPLASGSWKLEGPRLTLTYDHGVCTERPGDRAGVYSVVISKIGIHFTKIEDSHERRSAINGQTCGGSSDGRQADGHHGVPSSFGVSVLVPRSAILNRNRSPGRRSPRAGGRAPRRRRRVGRRIASARRIAAQPSARRPSARRTRRG
jgi:hypothetical protein